MIVCGVDISGSTASMVLLTHTPEGIAHIPSEVKKLDLGDDQLRQSLLTMTSAIDSFARQTKVEKFILKSRLRRGKLRSGGVTFKIEALFQLSDVPVVFVPPQTLAKFSKGNMAGKPDSVFAYQEDAFLAGAWYLSQDSILK